MIFFQKWVFVFFLHSFTFSYYTNRLFPLIVILSIIGLYSNGTFHIVMILIMSRILFLKNHFSAKKKFVEFSQNSKGQTSQIHNESLAFAIMCKDLKG